MWVLAIEGEDSLDSLKTELDHDVFLSREHARQELFEYIEVFYNRQRRHSALGLVSPAVFEELRTGRAA